jgi:hypothetical protein
VDDLLIFTNGEAKAEEISALFNDNAYGLKFVLELPQNYSIPFLDFKISVSVEGVPLFDFYRKPMRKDNFINAKTALPNQAINSIIQSERHRISKRCSNTDNLGYHLKNFENRLVVNGHKPETMRLRNNQFSTTKIRPSPEFYLKIPFISNTIEHKIRSSLMELGVKIHIAHKGKKLKHFLSNNRGGVMGCNLNRCPMSNNLCLVKGVVYFIECVLCKANYIGSTFRHLHLRFKEHLNTRSSPIFLHNLNCSGQVTIRVLSHEHNVQRMRIKEAILIKQIKPTLNTKDDLFRSHILFE